LRLVLFTLLAASCTIARAVPEIPRDACVVREELSRVAEGSTVAPGLSRSHLGWRQQTTQLFEVELTVEQGLATCSVAGIARLRDTPDGTVLVVPIRQSGVARSASPCLVSVHISHTSATVTTSEASCQAQALCGGRVRLEGQRFELAGPSQSAARGPCFASPAP
jgi:hypothetical protein